MKNKLALVGLAAITLLCGCGKDDNTLKLFTEATFPPYEFLRGQEVVGVDIAICRAIAEHMGKDLKVTDIQFDAVIPAVISGKADLAAAGITITDDRKKNVDFSIPYIKTGIVVVYKKSRPYAGVGSLKGMKIGVQAGTTSETYVLDELHQEPERFKSPAEAVAALKVDRCAFVIADVDPAKNCIVGEDDLAISDFITSEEYAVAIAKGHPELLKAINETIAELKSSGKITEWKEEFTKESERTK